MIDGNAVRTANWLAMAVIDGAPPWWDSYTGSDAAMVATMSDQYITQWACSRCGDVITIHQIGDEVRLCNECFKSIKAALDEFLLPYKVAWKMEQSA